ncbi:hypothetical protein, conserved [Eimeria praecox]|uniref:Uncharacterized protein n=1 Tax=Eimeria praecox TaxID=51316 RepID=U6GRG7_9EIME|nr:hypothetical protein, conserved [Eimeria praecox]
MGTTAETADIKSGSLLRMGDVSTLHSSGTQITIHISANSTALLRPLRFLHSKGAVALSRAHMADLETCQRSTVVESVSCNVTGLTSFYSPHGTAEGSTPRERQYDRNAEQTQERNQEFLQYPTDQSRDMLHQGFVGSHHPYSEPIMENTSGTMTEEVAQAPATLVSVATDVQQQAGEGSSCRQRSKIVSQASSEPLRNSPMTPEYRRRASLNETAPVLGAKAYERLSPTRLFSTHHPSRELQVRSESSGQRGGRANQQPVLPQEEVSPSKTSAHNASSVPRCLHSNREWASEGQPWPHQGHATAPVQTNPAELTAIHGVRLRPISPSKATENSLTAKDLVISALCDQIQHQQWKLKVQENRLHNQEQRLHELEAFVLSGQQASWIRLQPMLNAKGCAVPLQTTSGYGATS